MKNLFIGVLSIALFGCGEDTTNNTATNNAAVSVTLFSYKFNPNNLTVPVGTSVTFMNLDPERHNVTISALGIDEFIDPRESWSYTFATAGEFRVENTLSTNGMEATIIVE